jgi:hypothetical protein
MIIDGQNGQGVVPYLPLTELQKQQPRASSAQPQR